MEHQLSSLLYKSEFQGMHFHLNMIDHNWMCQVELQDIDCLHGRWNIG